jgi:ABC-type branched-subunit amino acid transport system permease subunit
MNVDGRKRALWVVWVAVLVASLIAMVRLNRSAVGTAATNNR